jgi:hypothetical protein
MAALLPSPNPFPSVRSSKASSYRKAWCTSSISPGLRPQHAPTPGPRRSRGARSGGSSRCCIRIGSARPWKRCELRSWRSIAVRPDAEGWPIKLGHYRKRGSVPDTTEKGVRQLSPRGGSGFVQCSLADQHFMCGAECIEAGRDPAIGRRMQQGSFDLLDSNAVVERAFNVQLNLRRPV